MSAGDNFCLSSWLLGRTVKWLLSLEAFWSMSLGGCGLARVQGAMMFTSG